MEKQISLGVEIAFLSLVTDWSSLEWHQSACVVWCDGALVHASGEELETRELCFSLVEGTCLDCMQLHSLHR